MRQWETGGGFMDREALRAAWLREERGARIHGWDFSPLRRRYEAERDLPWDYGKLARDLLDPACDLLDCETGGGEFLLSLGHPYDRTAATEGYPPNVALCRERLLPLGIDFRACGDSARIPFPAESFDRILNRHGAFDPGEVFRLLRRGGVFLTEQVGADNDRDLVELVLPGTERPFPELTLERQRRAFQEAGLKIRRAEEAYRPIVFYDVGAFVWFARIIQWEFPGFSVDRCFAGLLRMEETVRREGRLEGTLHRLLIIAEK